MTFGHVTGPNVIVLSAGTTLKQLAEAEEEFSDGFSTRTSYFRITLHPFGRVWVEKMNFHRDRGFEVVKSFGADPTIDPFAKWEETLRWVVDRDGTNSVTGKITCLSKPNVTISRFNYGFGSTAPADFDRLDFRVSRANHRAATFQLRTETPNYKYVDIVPEPYVDKNFDDVFEFSYKWPGDFKNDLIDNWRAKDFIVLPRAMRKFALEVVADGFDFGQAEIYSLMGGELKRNGRTITFKLEGIIPANLANLVVNYLFTRQV